MTITRKKIRLQSPQIQRNHPDPMRPIHNTQYALPATNTQQPLKREPHPGIRHHRIKHRRPHPQPFALSHPRNNLLKRPNQLPMTHRKRVLDPPQPQPRPCLRQRHKPLLHSAVPRREVDYDVALAERQVVQHGGDARRGVLDEHAGAGRHVEELRDLPPGFVEEGRLRAPDEGVGLGFGGCLEFAELGLEGLGDGAEGACLVLSTVLGVMWEM